MAGEVVGVNEVGEMLSQLIVIVIVVAMNGRLFNCPIHALNPGSGPGQALAIGPRMPWLGEPMINVVSGASTLKGMAPEQFSFCPHLSDVSGCPALAGWIGELNAIVSENGVDCVENRSNQIVQELF